MTTPIDTTRLREACVDVEAAAAAVAAAEKAKCEQRDRCEARLVAAGVDMAKAREVVGG